MELTRARKLQGRVEPVKVVMSGNGLIYDTGIALFALDCQEYTCFLFYRKLWGCYLNP